MFESTIHRLRIFRSVIECGSFNAASRKLRMTQPSISAHIQALEQELGKKLFTRRPGRKAELTEAGEVLYAYAMEITSKTSQFESNFQKVNKDKRNVSVAAQRNIANYLLPRHLASFSRTHPDFNILVYSQTRDKVIDHIWEGKADLGLVMSIQPIDGLYSEILSYQYLELVVGPTHELANRTNIDPKELESYTFVGALKTSNHAKMIDASLQKLGIRHYNVGMQLEDSKTIVEVVKHGVGIAALLAYSIQEELERGELVSLSLNRPKITVDLRLIYNPELKMSDEVRLFMVYLRSEMQ